jgi:hypothetical protein
MFEEQYKELHYSSTAGLPLTPLQITGPVLDEHGQRLDTVEWPKGRMEIRRGLDVREFRSAYLNVNPRIPLGDCLGWSIFGTRILSVRALGAFAENGVRIAPSVHMLALYVRNSITKEIRGEYRALWPAEDYAVLGPGAVVDYYPGGREIRKVDRWELNAERLPPFDLFRTESGDWLATQRVWTAIDANELTGFKLTPLRA